MSHERLGLIHNNTLYMAYNSCQCMNFIVTQIYIYKNLLKQAVSFFFGKITLEQFVLKKQNGKSWGHLISTIEDTF